MTREEHLKFCKKCTNRKMDMQQGLICNLTGQKADFEETCNDFIRDEEVKEVIQVEGKRADEIIAELPVDIKKKLIPHQDLSYAIIGGLILTIICGLIWAVITVSTKYQVGYMALGVGLAVGMGVRFFGAGIDPIYGYIGGLLALIGCLLGNLFSQVGFIAQEQGLGYFHTLTLLNFDTVLLIYKESFSPMDLVFYGLAVYEGYKFAFRPIPENIKQLTDLTPAYSKLRLPLVFICFIILTFFGYSLSKGVDGQQTYYYENGKPQVITNYVEGIENGIWEWRYESGQLMRKGAYKNGLFDGVWLNYSDKGILIDSSNYLIGRRDGWSKSFYESGHIYHSGMYKRDKQVGEWIIFNEDGTPSAIGTFKDGVQSGNWKYMDTEGKLIQEINYLENGVPRLVNIWDYSGNQLIKDGSGTYKAFYGPNIISQEGEVKNGEKVGEWKTYYTNGPIKEIGEFVNDKYKIKSAWTQNGDIMIQNGNGEYISYYDNTSDVFEKGLFLGGLKSGTWLTYFPNSGVIQQEFNYKNGLLNGSNLTYFSNGGYMVNGVFENDKKVGDWTWYYESGEAQCTVHFELDQKQGDQIFMSESGRPAKKETYKDNELISEVLL